MATSCTAQKKSVRGHPGGLKGVTSSYKSSIRGRETYKRSTFTRTAKSGWLCTNDLVPVMTIRVCGRVSRRVDSILDKPQDERRKILLFVGSSSCASFPPTFPKLLFKYKMARDQPQFIADAVIPTFRDLNRSLVFQISSSWGRKRIKRTEEVTWFFFMARFQEESLMSTTDAETTVIANESRTTTLTKSARREGERDYI